MLRGGCATEADEQAERSAGAQYPATTAGLGGRRRVGRLRFTADEDKALMQWVAQHPCAPAQGRQLWEGAERASLTRHAWQPVHNRWRRHIQKWGGDMPPSAEDVGAEDPLLPNSALLRCPVLPCSYLYHHPSIWYLALSLDVRATCLGEQFPGPLKAADA